MGFTIGSDVKTAGYYYRNIIQGVYNLIAILIIRHFFFFYMFNNNIEKNYYIRCGPIEL